MDVQFKVHHPDYPSITEEFRKQVVIPKKKPDKKKIKITRQIEDALEWIASYPLAYTPKT